MAEVRWPVVLSDLLRRAASLRDEPGWEPLRPGVSIRRLHRSPNGHSETALLRYEPGASVPLHEHPGHEHILVLDGSQTDENGHYPAGTLVVNAPGSRHCVHSEEGCVVLIVWERGVRFTPPAS